jgi:hypothetical protein
VYTQGAHVLPKSWVDVIARSQPPYLGTFVVRTARREIEDVAALAFAKLPPELRAELLATGAPL